jgi:catalase
MEDAKTKSEDVVYTTSNGAPYPHPYETQRMGENGPLLLQDFHLVDLLSHFDREVGHRCMQHRVNGANIATADPRARCTYQGLRSSRCLQHDRAA